MLVSCGNDGAVKYCCPFPAQHHIEGWVVGILETIMCVELLIHLPHLIPTTRSSDVNFILLFWSLKISLQICSLVLNGLAFLPPLNICCGASCICYSSSCFILYRSLKMQDPCLTKHSCHSNLRSVGVHCASSDCSCRMHSSTEICLIFPLFLSLVPTKPHSSVDTEERWQPSMSPSMVSQVWLNVTCQWEELPLRSGELPPMSAPSVPHGASWGFSRSGCEPCLPSCGISALCPAAGRSALHWWSA